MNKGILKEGDPIEVIFEEGTFDWGTFITFNFYEEDEDSGGFLMYMRPPVRMEDMLREQIRLVPIDLINEVRRLQGT